MIRIPLCLSLLLCAPALSAQGWDWPEEDFEGLFTGFNPKFFDPEKPRFSPDGSVRRPSDPGGPTHFGAFILLPDGRLCISSGEGAGRCDVFLKDGQMRLLVTEGGKRLPFKFELGIGN
ncbi:hypothetical protein [Antarcticimicrobium luteum]|uniref:Uncharacterized protein n=1 Tax=Antarcticimicrobium luteum TaxID=2547397 RepID=A0A4R5V5L2_9RHOB|nr:hypothetical protein [Antarcticimicrobium luteum]TDK46766.1 hypothetical protein E1832_11740 [Antarcticimicrobium luteum]